jgi:hypothetical protein
MNLDIDKRYSQYSESVVLNLIHTNEEYRDLWISKYEDTEDQANSYFKDINCGCSPVLLANYKKNRFPIDVMTVDFINKNPECIDLDKFISEKAPRYVAGHIFSIPEGEGHYKEFIASIQADKFIFNHFTTLKVDDRILITFF